MSFGSALKERGPGYSECQCWDCLRAKGITPPKDLRDKFKRLYPSPAHEMQELGKEHKNGGHPVSRKAKRDEDAAGKDAEERGHLRAAVRNREAI